MTDDITMASLKINNATSISPTNATPESKRPKYFSMASCYDARSNVRDAGLIVPISIFKDG